MRRTIAIMAAALAASGCSAGADRAAAEAGVAQFHQMVEAGRYHDIYAGAADEFRPSGTEENGIRFLQMVHDRLGAVRSSSSTGWRVNFTPGGSTVSLSYDTQFASGAGHEDFVFRVGGARAQLVGYHVNAPTLLGTGAPSAGSDKPADGAASQSRVRLATPEPVEPPKPPEPPSAGGK
jgi:hypothetical protein